jgi:hypothetical protein
MHIDLDAAIFKHPRTSGEGQNEFLVVIPDRVGYSAPPWRVVLRKIYLPITGHSETNTVLRVLFFHPEL